MAIGWMLPAVRTVLPELTCLRWLGVRSACHFVARLEVLATLSGHTGYRGQANVGRYGEESVAGAESLQHADSLVPESLHGR